MTREEKKKMDNGLAMLSNGNEETRAKVEKITKLRDNARVFAERGIGHYCIAAMTGIIGVCAASGVFNNTDPLWRQIGLGLCLILGTVEAAVAGNNMAKSKDSEEEAIELYENTMTF